MKYEEVHGLGNEQARWRAFATLTIRLNFVRKCRAAAWYLPQRKALLRAQTGTSLSLERCHPICPEQQVAVLAVLAFLAVVAVSNARLSWSLHRSALPYPQGTTLILKA